MVEIIIAAIAGFISWIFTHAYYKKSSKNIPDWAKLLVENLPKSKPTDTELLKIFEEALDTGSIVQDPVFGHVACPKCYAPASDFEESGGADGVPLYITCPHCGWSAGVEV